MTHAIEEAIQDSRQFGLCFLSWADPEDRKVSMQLKEQRVRRSVEKPFGPPWAEILVKEWASGERQVKDFEAVAKACGACRQEASVVVCAATVGCDIEGKVLTNFLRWASDANATVAVVEGPLLAGWRRMSEESMELGWYPQFLDFVTTEFGEALARKRRAAVLTRQPFEAEILEASVVRLGVAIPLGSVLEKKEVTGAPRNPLLPHIAAHYWEKGYPEVRRNAHGLTGPGKWPLRSKEGADYEELVLYDRCAPPELYGVSPTKKFGCVKEERRRSGRKPWHKQAGVKRGCMRRDAELRVFTRLKPC